MEVVEYYCEDMGVADRDGWEFYDGGNAGLRLTITTFSGAQYDTPIEMDLFRMPEEEVRLALNVE